MQEVRNASQIQDIRGKCPPKREMARQFGGGHKRDKETCAPYSIRRGHTEAKGVLPQHEATPAPYFMCHATERGR